MIPPDDPRFFTYGVFLVILIVFALAWDVALMVGSR